MKGVILVALRDLVREEFGEELWESAVHRAGLSTGPVLLATSDVEDETALRLFRSVGEAASLSFRELARRFGAFWMRDFAPRVYAAYHRRCHSVRDVLEQVDRIHQDVTERIPRARPPRFEITWRDERTAVVEYRSERGLMDLAMGLVEGAGEAFGENVDVRRAGSGRFLVYLKG